MKQFVSAINQIAEEKSIPRDKIIETIEMAIAAAYKKDYGEKGQIVRAKLDIETGGIELKQIKYVIEGVDEEEYITGPLPLRFEDEEEGRKSGLAEKEIKPGEENGGKEEEIKIKYNPEKHILVEEAKKIDKKLKVGDELVILLEPKTDFGRVAAQTAKQVIIQRLREVERDVIYKEFKNREGDVISGTVQRKEGSMVFIDLGKTNGLLISAEQIPNDFYRINQRLRFLILRVEETNRGPVVILSRAHPKLVQKLFEFEVPEIETGAVEIKGVAREAGSRSKIAVSSNEDGVDPIGSLVGQKGVRVQTVINELSGEKIDIIQWDDDASKFITNALSPAKVLNVRVLNEEFRHALVEVADDQFSLAIGKRGQNVRLAAKLTGWKIDVRSPKEILSANEAEQTPHSQRRRGRGYFRKGRTKSGSMKTLVEKLKGAEVKLTVDLDEKDLARYLKETVKSLAGSLRLDGFRKGKVPPEIARKKIEDGNIREKALDAALKDSFVKALKQEKIDLIETLNMKILKNEPQILRYEITLLKFPEVELGNYRNIKTEKTSVFVTEKEIENALYYVQKSQAKFNTTDMPAKKGDRVEINLEVRHENKLIEGGKSENHPLIIGNGEFLPGFENQLIGARAGEKNSFSLIAPEDYYQKSIAGKKLDFDVEVKQVQQIEIPELSDNFARKIGNFDNLDALKRSVRDSLAAEKEYKDKERRRLAILDEILEKSRLEAPQILVDRQLDLMMVKFDEDLHHQGLEMGLYLAQIKKTQEDLRRDWHDRAVKRVKTALILREIGRREEIGANDEEILVSMNEVLKNFRTIDEARKQIDLDGLKDKIRSDLLNEKVLDFLESEALKNSSS